MNTDPDLAPHSISLHSANANGPIEMYKCNCRQNFKTRRDKG